MKSKDFPSLYKNNVLSKGYPDLKKLYVEFKEASEKKHGFSGSQKEEKPLIITLAPRLIDFNKLPRTVLIVGCGPKPTTIRKLRDMGYDAKGIEPVQGFVDLAKEYLSDEKAILHGYAEALPIDDNSQGLVVLESVMEHIVSPVKVLSEIYRVLAPGGAAYIITTNKYHVSFTGKNEEFNVRFYNWYPNIVKESYVHHHLHYDPKLANYSSTPAVHWYSFSLLCALGRDAGFSTFYSPIDLLMKEDPFVAQKKIGHVLLPLLKYHPWFRSLALTFTSAGSSIFMVKRND